jgi:hypothetical protein
LTEITFHSDVVISETHDVKTLADDANDLGKILSIPYDFERADVSGYNAIAEKYGDQEAIVANFPSALAIMGSLFDPNVFALLCVEYVDEATEFLNVMCDRLCKWIRSFTSQGARPIFLYGGPEYAAPPLMGPNSFKRFVADIDKRMIDTIRECGSASIMHCHGRIGQLLPMIRDIDPDGLHPIEAPPMGDTTIAEARKALGDICLVGNIQIGDLYQSTADEIDRQVRTAVLEGAGDGAFILGVSASLYSDMLDDKTLGNYRQYIESGAKYGSCGG